MNSYQIVSAVLAVLLYLPLNYQILMGQVDQNLATWILWVALDVIAATSMYMHPEKGNWQLPAAYTVGGSITILCLLRSSLFEWTYFETLVCVFIGIALVKWYFSGPRMATIISSLGMVVATLPQIKDAYLLPETMPFGVYIGYLIVNGLSVKGGKAWNVEERFYPSCCIFACMLILIFTAQKFF